MNYKNPYLLVTLAILIWSLEASFMRISISSLDNFQALSFSLFIAVLTLLILLLLTKRFEIIKKFSFKDYRWFAFLGLFVPFLLYTLYYLALNITTTSETLVLLYIYPIIMLLAAYFILNESLNLKKIIAILIGLLGVLIIITKGNIFQFTFTNLYGNILALLAGSSFGVYSILTKKKNYDSLSALFFVFLFGLIYSTPLLLIFSSLKIPAPSNFISLGFLGIFSFSIAYFLWLTSLKYGEIHILASSVYIIPALSLLFINIILRETIGYHLILGLFIILLGVFIQQYNQKKFNKKSINTKD